MKARVSWSIERTKGVLNTKALRTRRNSRGEEWKTLQTQGQWNYARSARCSQFITKSISSSVIAKGGQNERTLPVGESARRMMPSRRADLITRIARSVAGWPFES